MFATIEKNLTVFAFIALTFCCWGAYGPVLHRGQMAMGQSRYRSFLCVGLAYGVIAVVGPIIMRSVVGEKGEWTFKGVVWSLAGGAVGAIGALGIILAFNFGGKPTYVMPLVFGFAPMINALFTIGFNKAYKELSATALGGLMAGLIMVSIGAALILVCAGTVNKPHGPATTPATTDSATPAH